MLAETQDARYFERMASSLGDKAQVLPFIEGSRVLDVGAGGGELADVIRQTGREVWALDGSHAAAARMREAFPKLKILTGLAHELKHMAPEQKFDTIVCSSIFHEVYSYGTPETGPYSREALRLTLEALHHALEPGGKLIIRDGIMPTQWAKQVTMEFTDFPDALAFWQKYRAVAPFASWEGSQRTVRLFETADGRLQGNFESVMEFLYTYTWGWQSSDREMKELYGVFTQEEYIEFINNQGFTVESCGAYLQPGYHEALAPKVKLTDAAGSPVALPASNFMLVATRL